MTVCVAGFKAEISFHPVDLNPYHDNFFCKSNSPRFYFASESMQLYHYTQAFPLEAGDTLPGLTIAYDTYGTLNADGSNVVWICHALTASSAVVEWWPGIAGTGYVINPEEHFIVC